jgi:hypothetical protein
MDIHAYFYLGLIIVIIFLVIKYIDQSAVIKKLQKNENKSDPSDSIEILKMIDGPDRAKFYLNLLEKIDNSNLILAGVKLSSLFWERFFCSEDSIRVGNLGRYILHLRHIEDRRQREILEEMLRDASERSSDEILNYIAFKSDVESIQIEEVKAWGLGEHLAALLAANAYVTNILKYRHEKNNVSKS